MQSLLDRTNQALGRLDGITLLLPDPDQFIYTFVRKEAVLSSQIEGTQSSLSDLLAVRARTPRRRAARRHRRNRELHRGARLRPRPDQPHQERRRSPTRFCAKSIDDFSRRGTRADKEPGRVPSRSELARRRTRPRRARFVPPPWQEVGVGDRRPREVHPRRPQPDAVLVQGRARARAVRDDPPLPRRQRSRRDGSSSRCCCAPKASRAAAPLPEPATSSVTATAYYEHLQRVRTDGAWEDWLRFFLEGVIEVAESTTVTIQRVVAMVETRPPEDPHLRSRRRDRAPRARPRDTLRCHRSQQLRRAPRTDRPPRVRRHPTARGAGILREATGRQRGKLYVYDEYLTILNEGTEPL